MSYLPRSIRRTILEQSFRANVGHIGSALSVVEILAALYFDVLRRASARDAQRDRFLLGKGHAALALYAVLHHSGALSAEELNSFCTDGSNLGVHPEYQLAGIDFSTGSLGQALPIGVGCALAARMQYSPRRAFVLLSDAECNEGSVWEAVMFAAHHGLGNVVAIIDMNGQQALGFTQDVMNLEPMSAKWAAFGWETHECSGHNQAEISALLNSLDYTNRKPKVIVARTICGKGVSFMEGKIAWHYLPLSAEQYEQAIREVEEAQ